MISVKILDHQSEGSVEVGMIEFEGIKIWKRLDSGQQIRTPKRQPKAVPLSYRCLPTNRLSVDELEKFALRIADLLALDIATGNIDAFTWQAVESTPRSDPES